MSNEIFLLLLLLALAGAGAAALLGGKAAPPSAPPKKRTTALTPVARPIKTARCKNAAPAARRIARPASSFTAPAKTAAAGPGRDDRIAIIGFDAKAFRILLPTRVGEPGVERRIRELSSPARFKNGSATNLSAGLEMALDHIEGWKGAWLRRIVVVSDGEPNADAAQLPGLADRARKLRTSIAAIHIGGGGNAILRHLVDRTVGGWFEAVGLSIGVQN